MRARYNYRILHPNSTPKGELNPLAVMKIDFFNERHQDIFSSYTVLIN